MKPYAELACDNLDLIQSEIYTFLINDIVFHSRIPHSVIKLTPDILPRIVASFTFVNQPTHLLR